MHSTPSTIATVLLLALTVQGGFAREASWARAQQDAEDAAAREAAEVAE